MAKATLQTVDRALQLLEILAEHPEGMCAKDIELVLALNKVTVHRLLATLENRGFIERESNSYRIGLKVVELSSMRLDHVELKTEAGPYLRQLVRDLGKPVQMAILDDLEAIFIEKIQSVNAFRMYSQIGKRIPLYASGVGKALLLQEEDRVILEKLSSIQFEQFTNKTLQTPEAVLQEIQRARQLGYALDNEEHEKGIFCIAVPIYDYRKRIIAALSVGGCEANLISEENEIVITRIKDTAMQISRRLGYRETNND